MDYHWSVFGAVMLLSGGSCAVSGLYLLRRPGAVGRVGLAAVLVGSAVWGLAYGVELGSLTRSGRELWGAVKYAGIVFLPPAWLVFSLQYTGRERSVTPRLLAALSIEPAAVLLVLAVPSARHLVRSYPADATSAFVQVHLGPVFYVLFTYSAVLALIGTGLLSLTLMRVSAAYQRQSVVLLSAVVLVWTTNILSTVGVGPFRVLDPTPLALAVAGLTLILGVFRFGLLDLVPVARTTLVETMPDPVLVLDAHHRVIDHNPAAERVLGVSKPALLGVRLEQLLGEELPVPGRDTPTRHELTLPGTGAGRSFELVMSVLGEGRSDGPGHLVVLRDITARKEAERRLEQLAHFDGVTGLPNRTVFHDRLEQALAQARRRDGSLAVLFLDLDRFKLINDSLGHDVGDEVLLAVSRRLQGLLRSEDTLARFGGDEFSLLLPTVDQSGGPREVAQKILAALAEPLHVNDQQLVVGASIGVAVYPGNGTDQQSLMKQSDAAMYEAKAHGGNMVHFATPHHGRATVTRLELERDLRTGLDHDLFLDFQPVVDMATEAVWGYEALVRWRHPRRGVIGPSDLVPLVEETGLSSTLDQWVLRDACQQVQDFDRQLPVRCYLSVNVCPAQLRRSVLPRTIEAALEATGFDGSRLVLEVSERAVTDDAGHMAGLLKELRSLGVSVALDDFGAGSTSLGQLGELTLDFLKIDRRFVSSLTRDAGPYLAIVESVTKLAQILGISVVAEGVETDVQRKLLIGVGCNLGQGFLIARPQPILRLAKPVPAAGLRLNASS